MRVGTADILQLGAPGLRLRSREVGGADDPALHGPDGQIARLQATLEAFRREHGFGRAIAAPQIGLAYRIIAVNLGTPFVVIDPEIVWRSDESFTLWDDCMSFPSLLVRVRRHRSISLRYRDEHGQPRTWEHLDPAAAELLQHEIDHLDGILAVDRADGPDALVTRAAYEQMPAYFQRQVQGP